MLALFMIGATSHGQTKICGETESFHPLDREMVKLQKYLQSSGVDTIIIYRHWIYTNGFNGYGKALWKKDGKTFQLILNYNKETLQITRSDTLHVSKAAGLSFFFNQQIDTINSNPVKQDYRMSHDGRHYISIRWGDNSYCYTISNLLVQFNPNSKRVQWINFFKEDETDQIRIDGVKVR